MNINISNRIKVGIRVIILTVLLSSCGYDDVNVALSNTSNTCEMPEVVSEYLAKLPEHYQKKLKEEEWEVTITTDEIEHKYAEAKDESGIVGLTDTANRKIYVEEKFVETALMHELCHACVYNFYTESSFYIKYGGVEEEMKNANFDIYYKENYDEYIIESMARYVMDKNALADYPITQATVIEMLEGTEWIYEQ